MALGIVDMQIKATVSDHFTLFIEQNCMDVKKLETALLVGMKMVQAL
jgi:hypothetical protein